MSTQNLVSATLDPATKTTILTTLATLKNQLDFKVSLTPDEIRGLPKAGESLSPLIDKAAAVIANHPQILPRAFNEAEFKRDYQLQNDLLPIVGQINELAEIVNNTLLAIKSDLFTASLEVYSAATHQADKVAGLNETVADMKVHFKRTRKTAPTVAA